MAELIPFCEQFSPLTEIAIQELLQNTTVRSYKKGEYILREGEICRYLFFINGGLVKSSQVKDEKEFIMRFFNENVLFSVFDSYVTQTASKYTLVALEDTTLTLIRYELMLTLCQEHHCVETFFRKLLSVATVKMMKRISEILEDNATERYNQFVNENSTMLQRISLGDLAKYLGITQQSLSRIRGIK